MPIVELFKQDGDNFRNNLITVRIREDKKVLFSKKYHKELTVNKIKFEKLVLTDFKNLQKKTA